MDFGAYRHAMVGIRPRKEGAMNMVEPGHALTATRRDPDGRCTTVCECGWVSQPGLEAQPFLEAREHIWSVRADNENR